MPGPALSHGFKVIHEMDLPEYRATGVWARHEETGCELFHVRNDDPENLFSFVFKTLPSDSTGVPHIMEHTVLCGSDRYRVKDPFVMLMRGSLNTFVNAMTYPDKTIYPASSTVHQDLLNIMEVYGDAVFSPLLRDEFFRQEGHRVEFGEDGALELTGIVYNEMKGNYSNHDSLVAEWGYRSLFPDTPYVHDAGGDPAEIPNLTYEQFRAFHERNYHPANTRVFLYGDIPTETYMEFLQDRFLSGREWPPAAPAGDIPPQPRWSEPRNLTVACPADDDGEGVTSLTVNWLLESVVNPDRVLALQLLSEILLGTSAAPLRKALIDSGLGEDLSAATGLETELREMVFSAGLRGIKPDDADRVEHAVLGEVRRLAADGFDRDIVEAALRKVEFRNREMRGGPNGLRLMSRSLRGWLHGEPPDATMRFQEPFARLREAILANPDFFRDLVREVLLDNTHRTTVLVQPDPELREREQQALHDRLESLDESLTNDNRTRIREEQEALARLQQEPDPPEAVEAIPFLTVADLPRDVLSVPTAHGEVSGVPYLVHDLYSNGVVYVDLAFDLSGVPDELSPYLAFAAGTVGELGLPGRTFDRVATEVALSAGGLHSAVDAALTLDNPGAADRRLYIRLKALESTLPSALDLVAEILTRSDLRDERRLSDLWKERRSELSGAILPAGSGFAALRAGRAFSDADRCEETWQGISQLLFLQPNNLPVAQALADLNRSVFTRGNLMVNVTGDETGLAAARPAVERLIAALPEAGERAASIPPAASAATSYPDHEALVVPSDVAYVAAAMPGSRFGTADHTHELILAHLLRTGALWESIRMQGGAYGANASARGLDGVFAFSSYRDPRIVETIDAFADGLARYAGATVDGQEMELAQIGVTGHDIRPLSPGQKGMVGLRRHIYGVTDAMRQAKRDAILSATGPDIRRAAERLRATMGQAKVAVLAGPEALGEAERRFPGLGKNRTVVPL